MANVLEIISNQAMWTTNATNSIHIAHNNIVYDNSGDEKKSCSVQEVLPIKCLCCALYCVKDFKSR